jgi:hypothetical protein
VALAALLIVAAYVNLLYLAAIVVYIGVAKAADVLKATGGAWPPLFHKPK